MRYTEKTPDIEEYFPLYLSTGWNDFLGLEKKNIESALRNSFFTISVYRKSELIGFGRVLSDGVMYATINDVIVNPEFQNRGIGSEIVKKLLAECNARAIPYISLMAAKGTAHFYKKLGFIARPDDAPGMKFEMPAEKRTGNRITTSIPG